MPKKEWLRFQEAVARFLSAIGGSARVTHDAKLPDKDTGHPRQRDVWIEARLLDLFDVKVIVSCKMWARKVNSKDMDAFIGEMISSGAHKGVMYASGGFTRPALEKAKTKGITCCKLYRNEPADIPEVLTITYYCCAPMGQIAVSKELLAGMRERTFKELFNDRIEAESKSSTLLDQLVEEYADGEKESAQAAVRANGLPKPWTRTLTFTAEGIEGPMSVAVRGTWKIYRSRIEGHLVEGTYVFGENRFVGTQRSPVINMKGPEPGPGWEPVSEVPEKLEGCYGIITMIADARVSFEESFAGMRIGDIDKTRISESKVENESKKGLAKRDE